MLNNKNLSEKSIEPNPLVQFDKWYSEHLSCGIPLPNTVSLGTASATGEISVRTLLLKDFNETGFVFFTNYNSRKGSQLSSNPRAALLFYWPESGRQVRIEGAAERTSEEESLTYFNSRPRESQLSAWASEQSSVISDRQYLESRYDYFYNKFKNISVDKPPYWGGFRLIPDWFEFWQSGDFRLHDRLIYIKRETGWAIERLAP